MPADWADAYLAQARADLAAAEQVGGTSGSTLAMLLQMVFEKLSKAALLRSGAVTVEWARGTHASASRMLLVLKRLRSFREQLGGVRVWNDIVGLVDELERLHPQLVRDRGPQLEYPWEAAGIVRWPERHLRLAGALANPERSLAPRILRFAALLSARFDDIFP